MAICWDEEKEIRTGIGQLKPNNFFLDNGRPYGFEYELAKKYERFLNKDVSKNEFKPHLPLIPVSFFRVPDPQFFAGVKSESICVAQRGDIRGLWM